MDLSDGPLPRFATDNPATWTPACAVSYRAPSPLGETTVVCGNDGQYQLTSSNVVNCTACLTVPNAAPGALYYWCVYR